MKTKWTKDDGLHLFSNQFQLSKAKNSKKKMAEIFKKGNFFYEIFIFRRLDLVKGN